MNDVLVGKRANWAESDGFNTVIAKIGSNGPGARGVTELLLELDYRTEMINVHLMQTDEWLGEISHDEWAKWGDAVRYDVLQDMLTWPRCERGEPKAPPNDEDVVANLAALCRTLVTA